MTQGQNVTVANFDSGQNVQRTFYVVQNVTWSVRGWTQRQGTELVVRMGLLDLSI
jgi:hypothetical protein